MAAQNPRWLGRLTSCLSIGGRSEFNFHQINTSWPLCSHKACYCTVWLSSMSKLPSVCFGSDGGNYYGMEMSGPQTRRLTAELRWDQSITEAGAGRKWSGCFRLASRIGREMPARWLGHSDVQLTILRLHQLDTDGCKTAPYSTG